MIRPMETTDIPGVAKKANQWFKDTGLVPVAHNNTRHILDLTGACNASGLSFISETEGVMRGVLCASIAPNFYCPTVKEIVVVAVWVDPALKSGMTFYRLFSEFEKKATQHLQDGKANKIITYHIPKVTNVDYTKLGFDISQSVLTRGY